MDPLFFDATLTAMNITDQYTLMTNANASFAQSKLTAHWKSWITETDFQQIAAAGLNTVRLPVPHWAFNGSTAEPYWAYAEQPYISQAILWAAKYNLDVIMDVHTAPNSQSESKSDKEAKVVAC
jgi:glucan 1,3-beta-glucosidase